MKEVNQVIKQDHGFACSSCFSDWLEEENVVATAAQLMIYYYDDQDQVATVETVDLVDDPDQCSYH